MAPMAVCRFISGATMASRYSPAIGSIDRLGSWVAELCSEAWPVVMAWVTIEASSSVIGSNARRTAVVEGDAAGDSRRLGQDQLGPAGAQDRADLLQDVDAHGRRLEVGRAHGTG